ncbi:MAG: polysaccharide pyruvyl transferase family protein [Clostridia bacterium]|nr:polysaccharide pyruvyl transferase family protein [Clostridia bacterium]
MRFLLYDHSGCYNRGCEAIVRTTVAILRSSFPDCAIGLCSYNADQDEPLRDLPNLTIHHTRITAPTGVKKYINAFYYKTLHTERYFYKNAVADTVRFAKDYDVCLLIGGDTFCYGENPWVIMLTEQFKRMGKKVFAWGCSVGKTDLTETKIKTLCSMDGIFTRESLTEQVLKDAGVQTVVRLPDPAFTLPTEYLPLPDGWGEKMIGLNFSPLVERCCPGLDGFVAELIRHIQTETDYTPVLIPHVTKIADNDDYEYMSQIKEQCGDDVLLLSGDLTAAQYKGYIARTNLFMGARTHAIIGAYSSCVPAFAFGYNIKARGIAADLFGEIKCVRSALDLTAAQDLTDCLNELLANEGEMRARLQAVIPSVVAASASAGEKLKELLEKA